MRNTVSNTTRCKKCGVKKTKKNAHAHNKSKFQSMCKKCTQARERERKNLYPEVFRNTRFKMNYGITIEEWDAMLLKQENCCKICKKTFSWLHRDRLSCHVDHDHETEKVRGLLCQQCNLLLGTYEKIVKNNLILPFEEYLWRAK